MSTKLWIIAIIIFSFSFVLRLWNLGDAGRWSDEKALMEHGYGLAQLITTGNFSDPYWYKVANDHPPFAFYFYGFASYNDYIRYDNTIPPSYDLSAKGSPVFDYDLKSARMLSVIISSLSVLLVFFVGVRYFSLFAGIVAALIYSMLPHSLGYAHFVDIESWTMLFFTACVVAYLLYLEKGKMGFLILTGILTGINIEIKQSNVLILIFYVAAFYFWKKITKKKTITLYHFIPLAIATLISCFVIYPMPWFHLQEFINSTYISWFKDGGLVPEVIFGKMMGTRFFYYFIAVLVTTPVIILLFTGVGLKNSFDNKKKWNYVALVIWFIVPFFMMFFHHRQHMMRYIVEIFAPLALLAAIGFEYLTSKLTKNKLIKYIGVCIIFLYLLIIISKVTPYYLNYYNELVGGTKNVYDNKLFLIGWFGEGLRNPGMYVAQHAKKDMKIGMAINLTGGLYESPRLKYELFNPKHKYDYVIVNYNNIIRLGFNDKILQKDYKVVYIEKVAGIDFAWVYKHK